MLDAIMERNRAYQWQDVGVRLKRAREVMGLSQEQVAENIGVTGHMVWFWEAGRSIPRADRLIRLATLYGVTVDSVLGQEARSTDQDALFEEADLALRSASDQLTPEDVRAIRDFIRFVQTQRRQQGSRGEDDEGSTEG